MPLSIATTSDERLAGPEVTSRLRAALAADGGATLLLPTLAQALDAQRLLAREGGLAMGVRATTPAAWAEERWGVWGDGRSLVSDEAREVLVARALAGCAASPGSCLRDTPGTAALLSDLAREGLPWIVGSPRPEGVTDAEAQVASVLSGYAALLSAHGLVERCEAMATLPGSLAAAGVPARLVCSGLPGPSRAETELLCGIAREGHVELVAQVGEGPASDLARSRLSRLVTRARELGVEVDVGRAPAAASEPSRAGELSAVLRSLFHPDPTPVDATGAVRALLASGPSAEPALVAEEVGSLAAGGAATVALVATDPAAAWRELAPRLAARGVSVRAQLSVPLPETESGRAFLEFATSVARLSDLAGEWPAPEPVPDAPRPRTVRVRLGDMSWWPPRELSDFLLSSVSHVPAERARRLDAEWRGNRLLTPGAVLDRLQSERDTSPEVAAATRELLRGRLGSAASKLLVPYVEGEGARSPEAPEATAVLSRVLAVARCLKELGAGGGDAGTASPSDVVAQAVPVLRRARVPLRPELPVADAPCRALIASPRDAATFGPCSVDALVLLGQTSAESAVARADDERAALLSAYGVADPAGPMAEARARMAALVAAPRRTLAWERTLFGADGRDRYPSVMLGELMACHGMDADAGAAEVARALGPGRVRTRSEAPVAENASSSGRAPVVSASEVPAPAGRLDPSVRACVSPPPEGSADPRPVLSASQVETYLECPYKWFSLRRLRLRDADAGLSGAEVGTFAHRVLELSRTELLARAAERAAGGSRLERMRAADPDAMLRPDYRELAAELAAGAQGSPEERLPGSSVADPSALAEAREVLARMFDAHLAHQLQLEGGRRPLPQALVAHDARDLGLVSALRRDLDSLLGYESGILAGFEPRLLEWGFGRGGDVVEYAGVRVTGTVDRVDVDGHGQAVVIDYKHKSPAGFAAEYDAFGPDGADAGALPPRRVQSLLYAQVIRRAFPHLRVRGALYLCTKGSHALAGAVDGNLVENVFGASGPSAARLARVSVPRDMPFGASGGHGMEALLDACEEAVAARVERLLAGEVEAEPADAEACRFCPVLNCERRLS